MLADQQAGKNVAPTLGWIRILEFLIMLLIVAGFEL
jgi:hypothetical protein